MKTDKNNHNCDLCWPQKLILKSCGEIKMGVLSKSAKRKSYDVVLTVSLNLDKKVNQNSEFLPENTL